MCPLRAGMLLILLSCIHAHPIPQKDVQLPSKVYPQPISIKSIPEKASLPLSRIDGFLKRARVPTLAVGAFLGRVGFETPGFKRKCRRCCRRTIDRLGDVFVILRSCSSCKLDYTVKPSETCADRPLGYSKTASRCFAERCTDMLLGARPGCFCNI